MNFPQDIMSFTELPAADREIVWDKRHYLRSIPGALPKVLLAAHSWEYACLPALYGLLTTWSRPQPMDILQACNSIDMMGTLLRHTHVSKL